MKKTIILLNVLLTVCVYIGNYLYLSHYGFIFKCLASACFALIGVVNLVYLLLCKINIAQSRFAPTMVCGLVLAMLGDVFINSRFILGAALFAAGHICYFLSYCFILKLKAKDIIISAIFFIGALLFVLFGKNNTFSVPIYKYVCIGYAFIISIMTGKAISNFIRQRNVITSILFVGSVLFFFSDVMLFLDWFANAGRTISLLCMVAYYPAECLLARSIFFYASEKQECIN